MNEISPLNAAHLRPKDGEQQCTLAYVSSWRIPNRLPMHHGSSAKGPTIPETDGMGPWSCGSEPFNIILSMVGFHG